MLFVVPGPAPGFEFFHRACFELQHPGEPRMMFTPFQTLDAIKAHSLRSFCPAFGRSVLFPEARASVH